MATKRHKTPAANETRKAPAALNAQRLTFNAQR